MIDFRYLAALALYTLLIGPVVGGPSARPQNDEPPRHGKLLKPVKAPAR